MTSVEMRQEYANKLADAQQWNKRAEEENMPASQREEEWSKRMTELDEYESKIFSTKTAEDLASRNRRLDFIPEPATRGASKPAAGTKEKNRKGWLRSWMSYGTGKESGDCWERCAEWGIRPNQTTVDVTCRALTTSTLNDGYSVASPTPIVELKYFSGFVNNSTIFYTSHGNPWYQTRITDVANDIALVSEGSSVTPSAADPSGDRITYNAYTYRAVQQITFEELADSAYDVEGKLSDSLSTRFSRGMEKLGVAGDGSSKPQGLLYATPGTTVRLAGQSWAGDHTDWDSVMSLIAAVDPAYAEQGQFILSNDSLWKLRKARDSQGRYIFDFNDRLVQGATSPTIVGKGYIVSNNMENDGAVNKKVMGFYVPSLYQFRVVQGLQMVRLNELYAEKAMVGIACYLRFDAKYAGHGNSFALLKTSAT